MPSAPKLLSATLAAWILVAVLAACSPRPECAEVSLSAAAAAQLDVIELGSSFAVVRPCAYEPDFEVGRVFEDVLPEQGVHYPRVNFSVHRGGTHAFVLSQTEATVPFRAIPLGSHWLRVEEGGRLAEGFAGPAGTGDDIAYLRWRRDGVTFELAATLLPWLTERDVQDLAAGLMRE